MELTEHEKQMIAVAEGGDPNDPAENKDEVIKLPSEEAKEGETSQEEIKDETVEKDGDKDDKPEDGKDSEDESNSNDDDELTEEQKELQQLRQEAKERKVYEAVGGKDEYVKLAKFAKETMTEAELDIYNQAVQGENSDVAVFAAKSLQAQHELASIKKFGYQGDITTPSGNEGTQATQGYESAAQMQVDMRDPRYATDEAFRAKVAAKLAASPDLF